ncbi:MAG: twin-arginine translocase TatA/TatE family subunit [Alphaproteobacteria bacterium]|nr:twin-arginine translocase TatA/TatE family subunit [Alphaproteobacteria bacterium]
MGLSLGHIVLVVLVVLIVFGAGKLPNVMGDLAKGVKNFKKGLQEDDEPQKPADKQKSE